MTIIFALVFLVGFCVCCAVAVVEKKADPQSIGLTILMLCFVLCSAVVFGI